MKPAFRAAVIAAALVCVVSTGCAKHDETQTTTTTAGSSRLVVENPSNFPLYPGSGVMTVVPIDSAQMFAAIRKADPTADVPKNNYRGHEVVLQTNASMAQLSGWLATMRKTPPAGFHASQNHIDVSNGDTNGWSSKTVDGGEFETPDAQRSVYVFVADPQRMRAQLGAAFDLIDNYSKVPGMLRGPIDEEAKKQLGYSVTEMLDPKSPVGAAVTSLKSLQSTSHRAILLIDQTETK
jgi:hypothetical protein